MKSNIAVLVLASLCLVAFGAPVHAKVKLPSTAELIDGSAGIVLGEVKETKLWKQTGNIIYEKHLLTVSRMLKWTGDAPKEIEVVTTRRDPTEGVREDPSTEMPQVGTRVVVFLYKHEDGYWAPTSRIKGIRELGEEGSKGSPDPTLDALEKAIKSRK